MTPILTRDDVDKLDPADWILRSERFPHGAITQIAIFTIADLAQDKQYIEVLYHFHSENAERASSVSAFEWTEYENDSTKWFCIETSDMGLAISYGIPFSKQSRGLSINSEVLSWKLTDDEYFKHIVCPAI